MKIRFLGRLIPNTACLIGLWLIFFLSQQAWAIPALLVKSDSSQAILWYQKADTLAMQAAYDSCIFYSLKAKAVFQETKALLPEIKAGSLAGIAMIQAGKGEAAFSLLKEVQKLAEEAEPDSLYLNPRSVIYNYLGNYFNTLSQFDSSLLYFEQAVQLQILSPNIDHQDYIMTLNNLGSTYNNRGDFKAAAEYLEKAIRYAQDSLPDQRYIRSILIKNKGYSLMALGAYDQAISQYEAALSIEKQDLGPDHPNIAITYSNLYPAYQSKGLLDTCLFFLEEAARIFRKSFGEQHFRVAVAYTNLGNVYQRKKDFDQSLSYHQKALKIKQTILDEGHFSLAASYSNLASVFLDQKKYKPSISYFKKAHAILEAIFPHANPALAEVAYSLSQAYFEQQNSEKAFSWNTKAIYGAGAKWENTQVVLPEGRIISELLKVVYQRALYQETSFQQKDSLIYLQESLGLLEVCHQIIERQRIAFLSAEDRLSLNASAKKLYEKAQFEAFTLAERTGQGHWYQTAFEWAERSKSMMLLENLRKQQIREFARIPASLSKREKGLRLDLERLQKRLFQLQGKAKESSEQNQLIQDIQLQQEKLYTFQEEMAQNYPAYYKMVYGGEVLKTQDLQEILDPDQALLSYTLTDSLLLLYLLRSDTLIAYQQAIPSDLRKGPASLVHSLSGYINQARGSAEAFEKAQADFMISARAWYNLLWGKIETDAPFRIVVIPDKSLAYVPFEVLLQESVKNESNPQNWPFLLKKHQISYQYSASIWSEGKTQKYAEFPKKNVLAVAPSFGKRQSNPEAQISFDWEPLAYNVGEAQQVGQLLSGKVILDQEANIQTFQDLASAYKVLHIATHAQAHDQNPELSYLVFSPLRDESAGDPFFVRDIYGLEINAQMVVLSACESGVGLMEEGEGLMSLSRAFSYAGAASMVHSLWQIDDEKTADLMALFYEALKSGQTKDAAMRQAKLSFLAQQDTYHAHPFFWAAFLTMGDMRPLTLESNLGLEWGLLLAFIIVCGLGIWFWRKKHQASSSIS